METVTTYEPPEILGEIDDEAVHQTMLSNLPSDIDKTEGGFAWDFTRPAAIQSAEIKLTLNEIVQLFFPEWATGSWLDRHAAIAGITRREATYAETDLTVTGDEGTFIPLGFLFTTAETASSDPIQFEVTEPVTVPEAGTCTAHVRCTQPGVIGDVPPNSITLMVTTLQGIKSVTNPAAATGGSDEETDDELAMRIMERDRSIDSSFIGNDSDYHRWALEVDGVGSAVVIPEWQGKGTGTVKVVIMDSNGAPANPALIQQVYDHIMGPEGDRSARLAPIGAILTVVTAESMGVNVAATVILDDDAQLDAVQAQFTKNLQAYFTEAVAEGSLVYTRVGSVLSETAGVFDYTDLTVNEGTANIPIAATDYPKVGTLQLTEG